jgi:hypothetical protein
MARPRKRIELESGRKLDLNALRSQGIAQTGPAGWAAISWAPRFFGDAPTTALLIWHFWSATRGSLRLLLGTLKQSVELVAAPRHFGGQQWYFVCPVLGRRASVLWMPPGARCFASRQAWGSQFAYASQFQTANYRAHRQAHQIHCRLSGEECSPIYHVLPPPRPRYMHRNTYEKLLLRLIYAENRYKPHLEARKERSDRAIERSHKV